MLIAKIMFMPEFKNLPTVLPVFPLSGAVVMPGTQLPLNIFEPRYLDMITHTLGGDRIIGMIQPRLVDGDRELCLTGCAGRITSFSEADDERFFIVLSGLCRFDVLEEITTEHNYRSFHVDWSRFESDYDSSQVLFSDNTRDDLLDEVKLFASTKKAEIDIEGLQKLDDVSLVNVLTCGLGFEPTEVQGLIESVLLEDRCKLLSGLLQMEMHSLSNTQSLTH